MERELTPGEDVYVHGTIVGFGSRGYAVAVAEAKMVLNLTPGEFTPATTERTTMTGHKLLRYFRYEHLPEDLQSFARPFAELAQDLAEARVTDEAERTVALRKLLEAKDAAVRSVVV